MSKFHVASDTRTLKSSTLTLDISNPCSDAAEHLRRNCRVDLDAEDSARIADLVNALADIQGIVEQFGQRPLAEI